MSEIAKYPTKAFKESQKFFVYDPSTGSPNFVTSADFANNIENKINYVRAQSTRSAAQKKNYKVGTIVQTAGTESPGYNAASTYLVVNDGEGDFPMDNGNELKLVENRVIPLPNITSLSSLNTAALVDGQSFEVVSTSRAGLFVWTTGDQSSNVSNDPRQGVWIAPDSDPTGPSGAFKRTIKGVVFAHWFGVVGDGVSDDTVASGAAVDYICRVGGNLVFDGRKTPNVVVSDVIGGSLQRDVKIGFWGAKISASSTLDTFVFDIRSSTPYQNRVKFYGSGEIDVSAIPAGVAGTNNAGTGINLVDLSSGWKVEGIRFIAGADYLDELGDTGITPTDCRAGTISDCYFQGFFDNGVYVTGDNDAGDDDNGGPTVIRDCHFLKCSNGISTKRKNWKTKIIGNQFDQCQYDIITLEVAAGEIQPGEEITADDNDSKGCVRTFFENRGGEGRHIITNNRILDFGYELNGTLFSGTKVGIYLRGGQHCTMNGNIIGMVDKADSGHIGIAFNNITIDATTYSNGNNLATGNTFKSLTHGVRELADGDGNNRATGNNFDEVTTPYLKISDSSKFYESYVVRNLVVNFGTVTNGSVSSIVSPSIPGVKGGAVVNITRVGGGLVDPRIQFGYRAVTNAIDIQAYNNTGSSQDLSAATFDVEYVV